MFGDKLLPLDASQSLGRIFHGDDNGLVLPPAVAPIQVVIVPIRQSEAGVLDACKKLYESLKKENVRVKLDDDESKTPGWKFAEYEMKGIPLRVEVGPRDLAKGECVLTKRVNGEKSVTKLETLPQEIPAILASIHVAFGIEKRRFVITIACHARSSEKS